MGCDRPVKGWGLRYFDADGLEWRLAQIMPGGRLTLECEGRKYWTVPPFGIPAGVRWEPFEAEVGTRYESKEGAAEVAHALTAAAEARRAKTRA
jgi:hypothetical protein